MIKKFVDFCNESAKPPKMPAKLKKEWEQIEKAYAEAQAKFQQAYADEISKSPSERNYQNTIKYKSMLDSARNEYYDFQEKHSQYF